ncbi:MAG TPA: glycoside hydrolase family 57 protein [Thermoleophilia bacterium]|nr:glycoside hydrolase family 57 protein [Thermoleophilia bacterium]
MATSDPLHIAFVWHMHQPYYRSSRRAPFDMPWARLHALKDYLDMIEMLEGYPDLHQTFNLVPSLVEQLETYASGDFVDVYWEQTLKPAAELEPSERAFVVERMCEQPAHPRARSYPRYLELARKREAQASQNWEACAAAFTLDEIRDLQIWFNLAWFDPKYLEQSPLSGLVRRGSHFSEEDKGAIAAVQRDILSRTLPAYKQAAARGQIEISTSPYFHPILPLLINSDSARVAAADVLLPRSRFAHPEDALEQLQRGVAKHVATFAQRPQGVWCSEQAVGEDVIPLLVQCGFEWTISDETVLSRSLSGVIRPQASRHLAVSGGGSPSVLLSPEALYRPYRLERHNASLSIIFRDHTLSDLIGFAYGSWDSREAAGDLIKRLRQIRAEVIRGASSPRGSATAREIPLVTIALDGENAWEYYSRDGRDFLQYLYEGLSADSGFRCVTVSEHLRHSPASRRLDWLHTGSWIGGDLRTWIGDPAHGVAWDLLREIRDTLSPATATATSNESQYSAMEEAWQHILVAEGSDWFWWFGEHHHTELDAVWDSGFRRHLEEVYRLLGKSLPVDLLLPIIGDTSARLPVPPKGMISPLIDGVVGLSGDGSADEWANAGSLAPIPSSTMQRAGATAISEVRFGWGTEQLYVLVVPELPSALAGLEIQIETATPFTKEGACFVALLGEAGVVRTECKLCSEAVHSEAAAAAQGAVGAWKEVVELSLPVPGANGSAGSSDGAGETRLVVRIGRDGIVEHVFHSARHGCQGWVTS